MRETTETTLSIITVCLNDKAGLLKTCVSVTGQTYKNIEFIVIDGGSTDGSTEVIKQFSSRINDWISEKDTGIYNAMNKGIRIAKGEYCIFMNAGDVFFDNQSVSRFFAENPYEDILCGDMIFTKNKKVTKIIEAPREPNAMFFFSASLPHQSAFIRTDLLKTSPYDESYRIVSDFIFFFNCLLLGSASYRKINQIVSNADFGGVSNASLSLLWQEKERFFATIMPAAISREMISYGWDYKNFWGLKRKSSLFKLFIGGRKFFLRCFDLAYKIRNKFILTMLTRRIKR